jgi:hypothetical protein
MSAPAAVGVSDVREVPASPPSRRATWAWRILPPLLAYLAGNVVHAIAAALSGERYLTVLSRVRADAGLYAQVADHGYDLFPCRDDPALAPLFSPDAWCGSAGWFPLYPWLMHLVDLVTGFGEYGSGLVVTEISLLLVFVLLWHLLRRDGADSGRISSALIRPRASAYAVLAVATLLPSGIYLHAVFPMALNIALALACVAAAWSRRWAWAGLFGAAVAMTYPIGVTIAAISFGAVLVLVLLRRGELGIGAAVRALLLAAMPPVLGLVAVFAVHHFTVGHWNAYMMIQEHYGNGFHNPVSSLIDLATQPSLIPVPNPRRELLGLLDVATDAELWWSLLLVVLTTIAAVVAGRRGRLHPVDLGLVMYAAAVFIAPLIAGPGVSQYRSHALMLPAVLVLRHLPTRVLWSFAAVSAAVAVPMSVLFYTWLLF